MISVLALLYPAVFVIQEGNSKSFLRVYEFPMCINIQCNKLENANYYFKAAFSRHAVPHVWSFSMQAPYPQKEW